MQTIKDRQEKGLAVLIDPDNINNSKKNELIDACNASHISFIFYGGSLVQEEQANEHIKELKDSVNVPVVIFPGHPLQIYPNADAILLLSLISGRNPEFLIGHHVVAAPYLQKSKLEIISTGYLLVDGGVPTSASYMSNTTPIPRDKPDIAACTALAGTMLGHNLIYMDAGSGAKLPISPDMIKQVRKYIDCPLIIGGGIKSKKQLFDACNAGGDIIVVGNVFEKNPEMIIEFGDFFKSRSYI